MNYSISIMAHPDRKDLIPALTESLKPIEARVAWDQKNNIWDTCKRAWQLFDSSADYHLVLQDDSLICKNFHPKLLDLLNNFPFSDLVFSLYIGNRHRFMREVNQLRPKGGILIKENIHHEIALIFPTFRIKEMIEFCDQLNPENDKVINQYVTAKKLKVIIPLPTLIEHLNVRSLHNLNQSVESRRTSIWFAGR